MEAWLYRCATSGRFRKWRLPEGAETRLRRAIATAVRTNQPVKFVFEFGGYKLWRLPSTPEVDWAEFFTLAYYASYLAPMAAVYGPGVIFSFASDDYVVERMNNIPKSSTDAYCNSFNALLSHFSKYLPANLKIELVRLHELYGNVADLEAELAVTYPATVLKSPEWDDVKRTKMLRKAALNFCPSERFGVCNLEDLSQAEYDRRLMEGALWHDAFEGTSLRKNFVHADDRILIFTTAIPQSIPLGVTKSSVAKFWAGTGVLREVGEGWREIVLSPSQIEENPSSQSTAPIPGLELKNLRSIAIDRSPFSSVGQAA